MIYNQDKETNSHFKIFTPSVPISKKKSSLSKLSLSLITVTGLTRGRMLISEFCTA